MIIVALHSAIHSLANSISKIMILVYYISYNIVLIMPGFGDIMHMCVGTVCLSSSLDVLVASVRSHSSVAPSASTLIWRSNPFITLRSLSPYMTAAWSAVLAQAKPGPHHWLFYCCVKLRISLGPYAPVECLLLNRIKHWGCLIPE